jgi:hypothetical protein
LPKIKIEPNYTAKYVPVILWWDDLTEIFEILQANAKAVELETAQYKFTTLDVAKEHLGDAPEYDVKISASSPYVRLEAGSLFVGSGAASAQIFLEVDKILKRRERRPKWFYANWLVIPGLVLGVVAITKMDDTTKNILIAIQIFFTALFVRSIFMRMKRGLVVYSERSVEARGFLQRNKDQLLMFILTALVSGFLGFAGSQLKDRLFPTATMSQK